MFGNILFAYSVICNSDAAIQAVSPTHRPAEISVPVSTMAPAIPNAIGSFAAVREIILTTDETVRNAGTRIAI